MLFGKIFRRSSFKTKRIVLLRNLYHCREIPRFARDDVGSYKIAKMSNLYPELSLSMRNCRVPESCGTHCHYVTAHQNYIHALRSAACPRNPGFQYQRRSLDPDKSREVDIRGLFFLLNGSGGGT